MDPLAPTDSAWASIGVHGEPLGGNALASTESQSGRPSVILAEPSKLLADLLKLLADPLNTMEPTHSSIHLDHGAGIQYIPGTRYMD